MEEDKIIKGLESLVADRESFITEDTEVCGVFIEDKKILLAAIEYIKKGKEQENMEKCECEKQREVLAKDYNRETYGLVKKMKFDNDIKEINKKIDEVDSKIKILQDEKVYALVEKQHIEMNYYNGD